ncbi:Basic-leucine zipper (bZIP) transcription factor family protein [Rhynchospora pubera]|uniref:Basic-leucine zipper (BZIP) transcription factor family protein n=1 Tax=Rhynchospora pubera TaxID=906938 RepID=A0AAV8DSG3_9POAL|nr:Basic-leucine zipper (bZIP) transcription factor family protein [Rhynchospora pubera]
MSKGKAPMVEAHISQMPDAPTRSPYHRRAHSEIIALPDDLTLDIGVQSSDENDDDLFSLFIDVEKLEQNEFLQLSNNLQSQAPDPKRDPVAGTVTLAVHGPVGPAASAKSIMNGSECEKSMPEATSVGTSVDAGPSNTGMNVPVGPRHRYSFSLDETGSALGATVKEEISYPGSASISGLGSSSALGLGTARLQEVGMSPADAKKAMSNARLAELAISDPKKAKRIWANRQSAARSKERKVKYIAELENRVNNLRTESTTLSAQLAFLQKDTDGLTSENNQLRLRVQQMEQQVHLQDSLNGALRTEVNRLKLVTGQVVPNNGPPGIMPFGGPQNVALNPQLYRGPRPFNQQPGIHPSIMSTQQLQQLQLSQPPHQRPHQPLPPQQINMQQQHAQAMMQQQQAVQVQTQAMMQQQQVRMPSQAQVMMRPQPQVMMPPQGQGMMRQHSMMPTGTHQAELQMKGHMVVNKPEVEGNFENFN